MSFSTKGFKTVGGELFAFGAGGISPIVVWLGWLFAVTAGGNVSLTNIFGLSKVAQKDAVGVLSDAVVADAPFS